MWGRPIYELGYTKNTKLNWYNKIIIYLRTRRLNPIVTLQYNPPSLGDFSDKADFRQTCLKLHEVFSNTVHVCVYTKSHKNISFCLMKSPWDGDTAKIVPYLVKVQTKVCWFPPDEEWCSQNLAPALKWS